MHLNRLDWPLLAWRVLYTCIGMGQLFLHSSVYLSWNLKWSIPGQHDLVRALQEGGPPLVGGLGHGQPERPVATGICACTDKNTTFQQVQKCINIDKVIIWSKTRGLPA